MLGLCAWFSSRLQCSVPARAGLFSLCPLECSSTLVGRACDAELDGDGQPRAAANVEIDSPDAATVNTLTGSRRAAFRTSLLLTISRCAVRHPRFFYLVLHVAAHKLYPVRMRVLNAITGHDECLDIAYIPQVMTKRGSARAERSRLRRIMVLQRMLYLTFWSLTSASHIGVPGPGGEHGTLLAFPRLLLFICDQPEERTVLCLKPGMCFRPCLMCDVLLSDSRTPAELHAGDKDALTTILRHLEVHGHHAHAREKQRRDDLEKTLSINGYPPKLAAMVGLGTPPFLLHKIVALDVLHVSLTVTTVARARFLVAQTVRDCCGLV